MSWISERPIAHRGLHNGSSIPENSINAFAAAIEQNYPIELDIQLLADGELAVFHDKDLERMTGESGKITDQTLKTIHHFKLFGTKQYIPSLEEVLKFIGGRVPVLIEIKNEGEIGPLEQKLIETLAGYLGDVAVQAFNPLSLGYLKRHAPHILRGQLSGNFKGEALPWFQKLLLRNLLLNGASAPNFVAYDLRSLPSLPTTVTRRLFGLPLIAWTVRSPEDKAKASRWADNYIFDAF
ncbi:glycerophosphodiester phosphodiesterase [filamentous cyanobacterium CCP5]|nr:glycerophosphodiester phosphodiesterase [filamentous cyanobacterium CCP5]